LIGYTICVGRKIQLTRRLPAALSPTVFDCLAGIASNADQPKELPPADTPQEDLIFKT
jgi:hypothetical protein